MEGNWAWICFWHLFCRPQVKVVRRLGERMRAVRSAHLVEMSHSWSNLSRPLWQPFLPSPPHLMNKTEYSCSDNLKFHQTHTLMSLNIFKCPLTSNTCVGISVSWSGVYCAGVVFRLITTQVKPCLASQNKL